VPPIPGRVICLVTALNRTKLKGERVSFPPSKRRVTNKLKGEGRDSFAMTGMIATRPKSSKAHDPVLQFGKVRHLIGSEGGKK